MIKSVFLVTAEITYATTDGKEIYIKGIFTTKEKAEQIAEKAKNKKDSICHHKIYDIVEVEEITLDEEWD